MSTVATVPYGVSARLGSSSSRSSISSDQSFEAPDQYFGSPKVPHEIDTGEFFLFDEIYKPRPTPHPLDSLKNISQHGGVPQSPRVSQTPPNSMFHVPYSTVMAVHSGPASMIHDLDEILGNPHPAMHSTHQQSRHLAYGLEPSHTIASTSAAPDVCNQTFQDLSELIRQEEEEEAEATRQPSSSAVQDSIVPDVETMPTPGPSTYTPLQPPPRKRTVSEIGFKDVEEQPLIKLFKQEIVVHDDPIPSTSAFNGFDRYSEIREKNNQASRRSRMTRKEKEREMETKAAQLESDNRELRVNVRNLEELVNRLKKHLIAAIAKKN